jgi:hypothetical protein
MNQKNYEMFENYLDFLVYYNIVYWKNNRTASAPLKTEANSPVRIEQQPQEQESEENEEPRIMTDSMSPRKRGEH